MTPLKQLFRQPVRLLAIILLVGMASAFICLSAGVFSSAKATLAQIEERYVTIGIPTTETEGVTTEYNGLTLHHEESIISQDMWAYMDQLAADGRIIKGAYSACARPTRTTRCWPRRSYAATAHSASADTSPNRRSPT